MKHLAWKNAIAKTKKIHRYDLSEEFLRVIEFHQKVAMQAGAKREQNAENCLF